MVKYGRDCFQNFHDLESTFKKEPDEVLSDEKYDIEVYDSDFEVIKHSDGSITYEICLPATALPKESCDLILKIMPTQTASPPTYIKIPAEQIVVDYKIGLCKDTARNRTKPSNTSVQRKTGGLSQLSRLQNLVRNIEDQLMFFGGNPVLKNM